MSALDIADGAFAIMRARPRTVAVIAAAFVLPVQLLSSFLNRGLFSALNFTNFDSETGTFEGQSEFGFAGPAGGFGGTGIDTFLQYLILPFLGVALTHLVLGWRQGIDRSAGECLLFTLRKTHIIVAAFIMAKLIQVVTLLITTPLLMLLAPVIAAEGLGPIAAIKRSFQLGRRRFGQLIGVVLLIVLVNFLLQYALLTLPIVVAFLLGEWGWIAFFALGSIGSTVLTLLGTGAAVLSYIDMRNRTEGMDLSERILAARHSRG